MSSNLYEILQISSSASDKEIRIAYINMIKKFPNEKHPEEFKEIRKAYEVLKDTASRKEYDTMDKYGAEINKLEEEAQKALETDNLETAILTYKKIMMIEPSLHTIRNQLAVTLVQKGEFDKALVHTQKLVEQHPNHATYCFNLAYCYEKLEQFDTAIAYYEKAYKLDHNDVNTIFSLAELHIGRQDYFLARQTLENALEEKVNEGSHQFLYFFKLIEIDIFERDISKLEQTFSRIELLLGAHSEDAVYVATEYAKIAFQLYEAKLFDLSKKLTDRAMQLDPSNEMIKDLHNSSDKNNELYKEYDRMEEDNKILKPIKHGIYLYLFGEDMDEVTYKESSDIMYENMEYITKFEGSETIASLKRMIIKYPLLYDVRKDFHEKLMNMALHSKVANEQFEQLKNDYRISNPIKRLIALYLSDVSDTERADYFDNIMEEMNNEYQSSIHKSVNRLKTKYYQLYELNKNFFDKLSGI